MTELKADEGKAMRAELSARLYGLYVIIDPEVTGGRDAAEVAEAALRGGTRIIQLRDKARDKGAIVSLARQLKELCVRYQALLIINDHPDVAVVSEADGVHVGQGDMAVADVRSVLKPHQIIGRSNHTVDESVESERMGADHVALGNVYPTETKASIRRRAPTGTGVISTLKSAVQTPVVAIGGINGDNIGPVVEAGADAICVASAVGLAPNPEDAARRLVELIREAGGRE